MKPIQKEEFTLLSDKENISEYQWNKNIAKHFFCKTCGVYTHHIRRRDPTQISVNIMCVDDIFVPKNTQIQIDSHPTFADHYKIPLMASTYYP